MALKKEGTLIPIVLNICIVLSKKVSFFNAEIMPKLIPNNSAIPMAEIAKTNVLGNVSANTVLTFLPCLVKDSLRYGNFITVVVLPMVNSFEAEYLLSLKKV